MLRLDHVVYAVADLDAAAERLHRELGLDSAPGGRHVGWGTGNRIVALGDEYVELISAVAPEEARASSLGRRVVEATARGDAPFAICASTDDLDGLANRLGGAISSGARERSDGTVLRWRSFGLEDPRREAWMPFFISWDVPDELHPGRMPVHHDVAVRGIARIEVSGDPDRLEEWLDGEALPIVFVEGPPGIVRFVLSTAEGERSLG